MFLQTDDHFEPFFTRKKYRSEYKCRRDIEVDLYLGFLCYSAIFLLFQANVIMYVGLLGRKSCKPNVQPYDKWRNLTSQHCVLGRLCSVANMKLMARSHGTSTGCQWPKQEALFSSHDRKPLLYKKNSRTTCPAMPQKRQLLRNIWIASWSKQSPSSCEHWQHMQRSGETSRSTDKRIHESWKPYKSDN